MFLMIVIGAAGAWCAHQHWMRLDSAESPWRKEFWNWAFKGAAFPLLVWAIANIGWGDRFPPLIPALAEAQMAKRPWFGLWMGANVFGVAMVLSWWAGVTYLWILAKMARCAPNQAELAFNVGVIGFFTLLCAAAFAYLHGPTALGAALILFSLPVVHFNMTLAEEPPARPMYDRAVAQLKFGKYNAAELEVISQLEKCEDDFQGWMLLAELYAKNFKNMEDAARVILDICKDPRTQPVEISIACDALADWQMAAENPEAARAALELLCRKMPGSHFERMARQRMKQLPRNYEELVEAKKPKPIRLPSLTEEPRAIKAVSRSEAALEANRLSEKLTEDPNDISARETLAVVLAEKLGKTTLGVEQLKLLLEMADSADEQKAKWLAQVAIWEFEAEKNEEKFRGALHDLIANYPQTAQAFAAQRKLFLLGNGAAAASA
jgi:hypothetical protein